MMTKQLSLSPIEFAELVQPTGNIYKSVVIISKRAKQMVLNIKEELDSKLNDFVSHTEFKDNVDAQRQYEITQFYEKQSKPILIAVHEFLNEELTYRYIEELPEEKNI